MPISSIQIIRFGVTLPERRADPTGGQIGGYVRASIRDRCHTK